MSEKVLVVAGSVRNGSVNVKLAQALTRALEARGANVTHLSLADYDLPIFNADIDVPDNAMALAKAIMHHDGLVIVSPEYNASLTPLLKNALDWVSVTKDEDGNGLAPCHHKTCFLTACSFGATGGLRGLYHLRAVLMNIGAEIITAQLAVGSAATAFDDKGDVVGDRIRELMQTGLDDFLHATRRAKFGSGQ